MKHRWLVIAGTMLPTLLVAQTARSPATQTERGPYARIAIMRALDGRSAELEAGYIRHLEWHRQAKDTFKWYSYSVWASTERQRWIIYATFGHAAAVWRKHTTDPKTASAAKPVIVIEPLGELLAQLREAECHPANSPILRDVKGGPLDLNMLAKQVIRPALRNRKNYRNGESKNWKPLEWQGFYSLRRGIATQLTAITRDPMAAKGLLRHSSVNTTLAHCIKDVPEVTANGMAQVEQLFDKLDAGEQVVQ